MSGIQCGFMKFGLCAICHAALPNIHDNQQHIASAFRYPFPVIISCRNDECCEQARRQLGALQMRHRFFRIHTVTGKPIVIRRSSGKTCVGQLYEDFHLPGALSFDQDDHLILRVGWQEEDQQLHFKYVKWKSITELNSYTFDQLVNSIDTHLLSVDNMATLQTMLTLHKINFK